MKSYQIILSDIPWQYSNYRNKKHGSYKPHYNAMKLEDIKQLPITKLMDKDSICFMWATWPNIQEALNVMSCWDFKYKTCAFVWNKIYSNGNQYVGLGNYTRSSSEIVLLGTRGKILKRKSASVKQGFVAEVVRPHSTKPSIHGKIEELYGNEYRKLELFGRSKVTNWTVLGNEIDGVDIKDSIQKILK